MWQVFLGIALCRHLRIGCPFQIKCCVQVLRPICCTKSRQKVFLFAIHSQLYSFALRFLFLQTYAIRNLLGISSNLHKLLRICISTVTLLCIVKEKGGKSYRKPCSFFYVLRKPYRIIKSEDSQDYAQQPQPNCIFMNSASGLKAPATPPPPTHTHNGVNRCKHEETPRRRG